MAGAQVRQLFRRALNMAAKMVPQQTPENERLEGKRPECD